MVSKPALDTIAIVNRLKDFGVEFIIIGGIAAITYGSDIPTKDLDICAPMTSENVRRIICSLADVSPRWLTRPDLPVITPQDSHLNGIKNLYLVTDIGRLDVLEDVPDVCSYAELKTKAVEINLESMQCHVIDIDSLIAAKQRAGRPHDLRTIEFLNEIKRRKAT